MTRGRRAAVDGPEDATEPPSGPSIDVIEGPVVGAPSGEEGGSDPQDGSGPHDDGSGPVPRDGDDGAEPGPPGPDRPSPPARLARAVRRSTPAARAWAAIGLVLVAAAVAVPIVTRSDLATARTEAAATRDRRADAADARAAADAARATAVREVGAAGRRAALAQEARNEQRARLAALGLSERTIDAVLEARLANTELVEYRRDRTTADVDRQAQEIPQMEECLERASQTVNEAFTSQFGGGAPPGPSELCQALLG